MLYILFKCRNIYFLKKCNVTLFLELVKTLKAKQCVLIVCKFLLVFFIELAWFCTLEI